MARRRRAAEQVADVGPVAAEYRRVWEVSDDENAHPFGPGRAFPDFQSWCAARAALVDSLDAHGIHAWDFEEAV